MIVTDLDGTLLNSNGECSKETVEYLRKLKEKNYIIVIASGRTLSSVKRVTKGDLFADYIISSDGSSIYDNKNQKTLKEVLIPRDDTVKIYNLLEDIDGIFIKNDEGFYEVNSRTDILNNINAIVIKFDNNNKVLENQNKLNNIFNNIDFKITQDSFNDEQRLSILGKGINKYSAISYIASLENVSNDDIIAFGDGLNDLEMITNVGNGVAMGNALDELKKAAKYVTLSNNENGIKVFLENMI